jgi:hypothetical protein
MNGTRLSAAVLALSILAATLAARTSLDEQMAQACRDLGFADGTAAMTDRVQRLTVRAWAERRPAVPPTFGGNPGCFPSRDSGVAC